MNEAVFFLAYIVMNEVRKVCQWDDEFCFANSGNQRKIFVLLAVSLISNFSLSTGEVWCFFLFFCLTHMSCMFTSLIILKTIQPTSNNIMLAMYRYGVMVLC